MSDKRIGKINANLKWKSTQESIIFPYEREGIVKYWKVS